MNKITILALKTNLGYYISEKNNGYYSWNNLGIYYFDGKKAQPTFHKSWFFIEKIPEKIEILKEKVKINFRYELFNPELENENIPAILSHDVSYIDHEGDTQWKEGYKNLRSLYELKYDEAPDTFENVDFEFIIVLELNIDKISDPIEFSYPISIGKSYDDTISLVTNKNVTHQLIDEIIFPQVILHETPASFSSKQVYDIVRHHIKQNIDMRYAKIISDYNFCFEVVKILDLANPYYAKYEVKNSRGNSYKPKKYGKKLISTRSPKIFEMTHGEAKYQGYTVIEPMKAESELKLKEKMDKILSDIMQMINEPMVECKCCDGAGVVPQSKIDA